MNKRGILVSLVAVFLSIPSVFAQDNAFSNIGESLFKVFGWVFVDLSQHAGDNIYFFWVKFLLFVLLLSVYFYGTLKVFKETQRRIATTVALVLALMSVIMIPNELLVQIMKTYTVIAAVVVMAIPIIAVFMINHYVFKGEDNPAFNGVRAILYLLIAFVFGNIAGFQRFLDFKYFAAWAGFAEALCIIAAIYNIIKLIMGVAGPGVAPSMPGAPARPGEPSARPGEPAYPNALVTRINEIGVNLARFRDLCNRYMTAVSRVLAQNNANVVNTINHYHLGGVAHVGDWHPPGWGLTQGRVIHIPGPYAATEHLNPDPALQALVTEATNLLTQFNALSTALRDAFDHLFSHTDFLRLNDHHRETAMRFFEEFSNREAEVLLFRVVAHSRYNRGQPPG